MTASGHIGTDWQMPLNCCKISCVYSALLNSGDMGSNPCSVRAACFDKRDSSAKICCWKPYKFERCLRLLSLPSTLRSSMSSLPTILSYTLIYKVGDFHKYWTGTNFLIIVHSRFEQFNSVLLFDAIIDM